MVAAMSESKPRELIELFRQINSLSQGPFIGVLSQTQPQWFARSTRETAREQSG